MNLLTTSAAVLLAASAVFTPGSTSAQHAAGGVVVEYNNLDVALVANGWSVIQLLRGDVYNASEEFVGYVHDAIVMPDGDTSFVVVNVAGFLGLGEKLIVLPAEAFEIRADGNLNLPNATKENLKALPRFYYNR